MFYLIGIGLKPEHISLEALNATKKCRKVFLESYTSVYSEGTIKELEKILGKKIISLGREEVEKKYKEYFFDKKENTALLVYGNPLTATTHLSILLELKEKKIPFKVIPSVSIIDFVSLTGLSAYTFGGITSIVFPEKNYSPESFYDVIAKNKKNGLHTLCLLDIKEEEKKFMCIREAIEILEGIQEKRKEKIISESIMVGMSAVGSSKMQLKAGKKEELKKYSFEGKPHSLIVCGRLNKFELNALKELSGFND